MPFPKGSCEVGVVSSCTGEVELLGQLAFLMEFLVHRALHPLSQVSLAAPLGADGKSSSYRREHGGCHSQFLEGPGLRPKSFGSWFSVLSSMSSWLI